MKTKARSLGHGLTECGVYKDIEEVCHTSITGSVPRRDIGNKEIRNVNEKLADDLF